MLVCACLGAFVDVKVDEFRGFEFKEGQTLTNWQLNGFSISF